MSPLELSESSEIKISFVYYNEGPGKSGIDIPLPMQYAMQCQCTRQCSAQYFENKIASSPLSKCESNARLIARALSSANIPQLEPSFCALTPTSLKTISENPSRAPHGTNEWFFPRESANNQQYDLSNCAGKWKIYKGKWKIYNYGVWFKTPDARVWKDKWKRNNFGNIYIIIRRWNIVFHEAFYRRQR